MRLLVSNQVEHKQLIDYSYLERLTRHLGIAAVRELLADGLLELSDRIGRVEAAADAGDHAALRDLTHDLVAVAGHLGLSELSAAAVQANRLINDGTDPSTAINPLVAIADPSIKALSQRVDEVRAG